MAFDTTNMNGQQYFRDTYRLRRVIFYGAVASSSVIFSVVFLLFLYAQMTPHPGFYNNVLIEMMAYLKFLAFVFTSYFISAIVVWRGSDLFSRYSASWIPVCIFGSTMLSIVLIFSVHFSSIMAFGDRGSFQTPPPDLSATAAAIGLLSVVFAVVTLTGCGLAAITIGRCYDRN